MRIGTDVEGYVTTEGPGLSAFALEDGVVYHTARPTRPSRTSWSATRNCSSGRRRAAETTCRSAPTTSTRRRAPGRAGRFRPCLARFASEFNCRRSSEWCGGRSTCP